MRFLLVSIFLWYFSHFLWLDWWFFMILNCRKLMLHMCEAITFIISSLMSMNLSANCIFVWFVCLTTLKQPTQSQGPSQWCFESPPRKLRKNCLNQSKLGFSIECPTERNLEQSGKGLRCNKSQLESLWIRAFLGNSAALSGECYSNFVYTSIKPQFLWSP